MLVGQTAPLVFSDAQVGQLAARISHDLNTQMTQY
jgi:hypothetical protein